jgi:chemotaxis protein CheC
MIIGEEQAALAELVGIGFERAAASLSALTGYRVQLDLPQVAAYPIQQVSQALGEVAGGEIVSVHQIFSGQVAGDALLILQPRDAAALASLLAAEAQEAQVLTASYRDILVEVGNIVLGACLGTFGNLLRVHVGFAVPSLQLASLGGLLESLVVGAEELRYALMILTCFHVRERAISGHLVVVLGVASLDRLLQEVRKLA